MQPSELVALLVLAILYAQAIAEGELYDTSLARTLEGHLCFSLKDLQSSLPSQIGTPPADFATNVAELCQNQALPGFWKLGNIPDQAAYFWYWEQWHFSLNRLGNLQMILAQQLLQRVQGVQKIQGFGTSQENPFPSVPNLLEQPEQLYAILSVHENQSPAFQQNRDLLLSCCEKLCHKRLLLISGGPGSGKTTLLSYLLQILRKTEQSEHLSSPELRPLEIALCAPTARAAQRMKESLHQTANTTEHRLEVQTLHKLLGLGFSSIAFYRAATQSGENYRSAKSARLARLDILVVDEASMLDSEMASNLLRRLAPQTRLILIGDPNQLPPIGQGMFWRDLLRAAEIESTTDIRDCLVCLKGSHRSNDEIQCLAKHVLHGEKEKFHKALQHIKPNEQEKQKIISWYEQNIQKTDITNKEWDKNLLDYLWQQWCPSHKNVSNPHFPDLQRDEVESCAQISGYFSFLQEYSILSPLRNGPGGAYTLNQLLLEYGWNTYKTNRGQFFHACPIQITRNNYALWLLNGDRGFCFRFGNHYYGVFEERPGKPVKGEIHLRSNTGNYRLLPILQLTDCEPSFVQTVHKSQGSEYNKVCVLLPESVLLKKHLTNHLGNKQQDRNPWSKPLLYTAITRAKDQLCFIGTDAALQLAVEAIKNQAETSTSLLTRLLSQSTETG